MFLPTGSSNCGPEGVLPRVAGQGRRSKEEDQYLVSLPRHWQAGGEIGEGVCCLSLSLSLVFLVALSVSLCHFIHLLAVLFCPLNSFSTGSHFHIYSAYYMMIFYRFRNSCGD